MLTIDDTRVVASPPGVDLFREYRRTRDPRLRAEIVDQNVGLARSLARRYAYRGVELDDLVQVAFWALLQAIERFDPERGTRFSSFATPTIIGALKRHFRDLRWSVGVPRSVQENYLRVRDATETLTQEFGRRPSTAEVAREAGLSEAQVIDARKAANSFRTVTLSVPEEGRSPTVENALPRSCAELQRAEDRGLAEALVARLPEREQRIVWLRYRQELSQREIAERIGISQMHVSRLLAQSLQRLRISAATAR
jgi:RNA polymerase sigma-B factor